MTISDHDPADYPKRTRTRLVKAEIWMHVAMTVQGWADSVADKPGAPMSLPFAEWPADDPMVALTRDYGLTPAELARVVESIADQLENRSMSAGYDETWR